MVDRPFEYDLSLLESCAQSSVANYIRSRTEEAKAQQSTITIVDDRDDDASCILLLDQYIQHYQRRYQDQDVLLQKQPNGQYRIGKHMEAFLRSVMFVSEHNQAVENKETRNHRVTLNQFSADPGIPSGLWMQQDATADTDDDNFWTKTLLHVRRRLLTTEESEGEHYVVPTILLTSMEDILQVAADMGIGKGSMSKLHKHKPSTKNQQTYQMYPDAIQLPTAEYVEGYRDFETPPLQPEMNGALLSIKRNRSVRKHEYFATHLNWATTQNPDGVPLVNPAFDQVCGCVLEKCCIISCPNTYELVHLFFNADTGRMRIVLGIFGGRITRNKCCTTGSFPRLS
jgi:hypothetical protein